MKPSIDQFITFLGTHDLKATSRFYEEVLGLPVALDQADCRIFKLCSNAFVGFCRHIAVAQDPRSVILTLVSSEVDAWHERLLAQGAAIEKSPRLNEKYQIYHLFAIDPNGYLVEIQEFRDPSWQG